MTQWNGCEWPKLKTSFTYFQNSKTEFQWQVGKLDEIVGPSPVHCHIRNRLSYYRWSSSISFQFSEKFLLKIFPLLTFLSQPLLIFTSLFIPNKLAPWHRSPWSKHWTRPKKDTAWLKNNAWSKHWTRPESSSASLLSSVTVSIPFSPSPRCNVYLSLPLHFPCPWSSLVFLLDVKEGFWFKVLMLIVACETTFLYNLLKH